MAAAQETPGQRDDRQPGGDRFQRRVAARPVEAVEKDVGGFVQAGPDFIDIPKVINGCSDLMVEALGDKGRHARSAVGVYKLPLGFAVEVDAVVEIA